MNTILEPYLPDRPSFTCGQLPAQSLHRGTCTEPLLADRLLAIFEERMRSVVIIQ